MSVENISNIIETSKKEVKISKPEKSGWVGLRDEKLMEYFQYLPDTDEYQVDDFRELLEAAEREQNDKIKKGEKEWREDIRILGSITMRLRKIIREFEFPEENYRNVLSAKEKYGNKESLYKTFDL